MSIQLCCCDHLTRCLMNNQHVSGTQILEEKQTKQKETTPFISLQFEIERLGSYPIYTMLVEITGVFLDQKEQSELCPWSSVNSQQCSHLNLGIISSQQHNLEVALLRLFQNEFKIRIRTVILDLRLQSHPLQKLWEAWQTDDIDFFQSWVLFCVFSGIIDCCLNWILMLGTICFMWGSGLSI